MGMEKPKAEAFRLDLPSYELPEADLISFGKYVSEFKREAHSEAKPEVCYICGEPMTSPCNSHTVPQYCLREIAVNGKLLTTAAVMGGNVIASEVGVNKAATFKCVCARCDTEFFKLYETPETLRSYPTSQVLGQIAAKNLLREISKARFELGLNSALGDLSCFDFDAMVKVRAVDLREDEKALKKAIRVGRNGNSASAFSIIYYKQLPYVVPFAFQQMVCLVSDFEGGVVNNAFITNIDYKMEPMHICVLPSKGFTTVLAFRSKEAKRYRRFERQFRGVSEEEKLATIVKLVFAYSEDVLLSKQLSRAVLENSSLAELARRGRAYFGFADNFEDYERTAHEASLVDFAISSLPTPPNLLLEKYSLDKLVP